MHNIKFSITVGSSIILMSCGSENQKKITNTIENEQQTTNAVETFETAEALTSRKIGCDFAIPQDIKTLSGAKVVTQSDLDVLLLKGAAITFTGSNNVIFVTKGAAATIAGDGNFIYMEKGGAATISGTENDVYTPRKSAILDHGEDTRIMSCEAIQLGLRSESQEAATKKSMNSKSELEKASSALADLTNKAQELSGLVISDVIPFNENDFLIGSWTVDYARFNDSTLKTKGTINLYANGTGIQNYSVLVNTINIPQIAVFKWERKGNTVHINADEESVWQLENTSKNKHHVVIDLGDGILAKLFLVRKT